ncbi:TPA: glycosyltransferase family 4 protein [Raoultella ornithinolytica]|nr:glycosyltransferase family 4 protein [Raoultella ornithinolytica]
MLVVLTQMAIADYRNQFISHLINTMYNHGDEFKIFVGKEYFEETTKTSEYVLSVDNTTVVKNVFFFNRRLAIQSLPISDIIKADVVICELNPRILSTWLILFTRKILRKRTILWGHIWARNGQESKTEVLRNFMRKQGSSLLLYTKQQKEELLSVYGNACKASDDIYVAPNSLYFRQDMENLLSPIASGVVYVGRLVAAKKVDILIRSIPLVCSKQPDIIFHIVGTGDQEVALKKLASDLGVIKNVIFYGHISEPERLKKIYKKSFVSISPGYVGLSITQSFSFGVPMIISKDEKHSPELEALDINLNGGFFVTDKPESLAAEIITYYVGRENKLFDGELIVQDCKSRYSVETMVEGVINSVNKA